MQPAEKRPQARNKTAIASEMIRSKAFVDLRDKVLRLEYDAYHQVEYRRQEKEKLLGDIETLRDSVRTVNEIYSRVVVGFWVGGTLIGIFLAIAGFFLLKYIPITIAMADEYHNCHQKESADIDRWICDHGLAVNDEQKERIREVLTKDAGPPKAGASKPKVRRSELPSR